MFAPALLVFSLAVTGVPAGGELQVTEVVADIRIQGNLLTSDEEVRQIAGVQIGMPVGPATMEEVAARLRAVKRFERVEVLKRFASIADSGSVKLVIIVDEGPVRIEKTNDSDRPTRVVRNRGPGLLFLPVIGGEDGYGLTYGARVAWPNPIGPRSRLSFPLTWGGHKRAAIELDKTLERGPVGRILMGASIGRRKNPFFEENDDRRRAWIHGEREVVRSLRAGATAGWQRASFLGSDESFPHAGIDVTLDTRLDPTLARNAVYARASWEHLGFARRRPTNRTQVEARGYLGLFGQNTLVVRALREDADRALPASFKSLLGGTANLRGFRAGRAIGDTLVSGSVELVAPLTSPLSIGKLGVGIFADTAAVYEKGQRASGTPFGLGYGGSVWFTAASVRMSLAVAHGVGASTRVHFGGGMSF